MSFCSRCGAAFSCAMQDSQAAAGKPVGATGASATPGSASAAQPCWCMLLPAVAAVPDESAVDQACWCPACVRQLIAARDAARPQP